MLCLANLREAAPDADQESWQILNVRRLCDTLRRDTQVDFDPEKLSRLLKSFAEAFGGGQGQRGFFALRPAGMDNRYIRLLRNWQEIENHPPASDAAGQGAGDPVSEQAPGQQPAGDLPPGRS